MATLAASAATLLNEVSYGPNEWYTRGKDNRSVITRRLVLVLTGQGGATNTIGASALGLDKILGCETLWDATNAKGYPVAVDPLNNVVILLDGSAAPAPVDVITTAAYLTVTGTVKAPSAT